LVTGCISTAAGDLYKIYAGEANEDIELGIKSVEWSPAGDLLAISGYDRRARILSTKTVGSQSLHMSERTLTTI
jgi:WD40 repeat protein